MSADTVKVSRGRPKTLNRDHIIDVAMRAYWQEGAAGVSVNEICRKANVSKPGLYREFKNEDGLMQAVLVAYQNQMLTPILQSLTTDAPFRQTLENLVSFVTQVQDNQAFPKGCLLVKMHESRMRVGAATREQIDCSHQQFLTAYEQWIERAKARGEFLADLPSQFAASYVDTQVSSALSQIARGEPHSNVKKTLLLAFSMLR